MRTFKATLIGILGGAVGVAMSYAHAQSQAQNQQPAMEIVDCVVYPEGKTAPTADCAAQVRAVCVSTAKCAVPIGFALTDGRQIDGDARTWKKVRIHFRCGNLTHVEGPYIQDDHATVTLSCGG